MDAASHDITPWAKRVEVPDGLEGTLATIDIADGLIRESLADPLFALKVREKIVTGQADRSPLATLRRVFDYVKANVVFQVDPRPLDERSIGDYVQSAHWTWWVTGEGDCLAHAILVTDMAAALGLGAALRTIHADSRDPERLSHIYALVGYVDQDGEHWEAADTSMPDQGFGYELPNLVARFRPTDHLITPAA